MYSCYQLDHIATLLTGRYHAALLPARFSNSSAASYLNLQADLLPATPSQSCIASPVLVPPFSQLEVDVALLPARYYSSYILVQLNSNAALMHTIP
jgi:hypothetical protein